MPSRRRRKEITAYDVANTPVQHLAAEENTKAIYTGKSNMIPVFELERRKFTEILYCGLTTLRMVSMNKPNLRKRRNGLPLHIGSNS